MKGSRRIAKQLVALVCMAGVFISCDKDCEGQPGELNSFALFQYEFRNEAWGHQHEGWFIDNEGNVGRYELPADWNEPDSLGFLTEEKLASNMLFADEIIGDISDTEINTYTLLMNQVDPFDLSDVDVLGADGGSSFLYGYQWKPSLGRFHRVLLAEGTDFYQRNLDPEAVEITEWLIDLGKEIDPGFQFQE